MRTTMLMSIQFCRRNMRIMIHFTLYLLSVELRGASRRAGRIGRTFTIINKNWDFKDISNFNFNYKNPKSVERCSLPAWDSNLNTSKTSSQSHKILSFLDHKWITTLPPGTRVLLILSQFYDLLTSYTSLSHILTVHIRCIFIMCGGSHSFTFDCKQSSINWYKSSLKSFVIPEVLFRFYVYVFMTVSDRIHIQ